MTAGGTLSGLSVTNDYDTYLRRTAIALGSEPSTLTQFGYDTASRLTGVTNGYLTVSYSYLANSPLIDQIAFRSNSMTRMTATKTYDYLNRLTQISSAPSADSPVSFSYVYNNANQRVRCRLADNSYWLYEHDSLGQVKSGRKYWSDQTPVAGHQFEYSFDDIGNRTQTKSGGDENGWNLRSASYWANSLNQCTNREVPGYVDILGLGFATNAVTVNSQTAYRKGEYFRKELSVDNGAAALWTNIVVAATGQTSITGNVFVPKTPEMYGYDADGNTTNDGRWAFTWDAENRLIQVESLTSGPAASKRRVKWEFYGKGRRIRQTTYDLSSGTNVTEDLKFLSDGWQHIAELNATNNTLVRSYVWGLDLSGTIDGAGGVGGLLAMNSEAIGAHFYAFDGNGNVAALVSAANGTSSANYEYEPFGKALRATVSVAEENRFQFSTKRGDETTDFVLYEYRLYNPSTGRWLTRDLLEEGGGMNVYAVVNNDPVNSYDALGLWKTEQHYDIIQSWLAQNPAPDGKDWNHFKWHCFELDVPELLRQGDDYIDGRSQGRWSWGFICDAQSSANSHRHSMRAWYESADVAVAKRNAFVRSRKQTAANLAALARQQITREHPLTTTAEGNIRRAVQVLGEAQHPLADETSPAHSGFQSWIGLPEGLLIFTPVEYAAYVLNHGRRESKEIYDAALGAPARKVAEQMHTDLLGVLSE